MGQCAECGKWSTIQQQVVVSDDAAKKPQAPASDVVKLSSAAEHDASQRISSGIAEVDRVFGGGIVPGSMVVLGGDPGIGKSTLALQVAGTLQQKVLYVSGEESANQIRGRFARLFSAALPENVGFVSSQHLETVLSTAKKEQPTLVVIDSIQMMRTDDVENEAGSVSQIRACAAKLMEFAKTSNTSVLLIGHVTKDGSLGGPKTLEHLVDVVMYLEGDRQHLFRILRSVKNRFGSISEVGIFDLTSKGFEQVENPSAHFLNQNSKRASGSTLSVVMEGSRPFLIELQALVSKTAFGYPVRKSSGVELNRLQLLTAVVAQRAGVPLHTMDIYMNTVGDISVSERVADLSICCALASAFYDRIIPDGTVILGEVGLSGEVRPVPRLADRLKEAEQLQMTTVVIPKGKKISTKLTVHEVEHVRDAFQVLDLTPSVNRSKSA